MCRIFGILSSLLLAIVGTSASADDVPAKPRTQGRVIGRIWNSRFEARHVMTFTSQLGQELNIRSPLTMFAGFGPNLVGSQQDARAGKVDVKGTLLVLETTPNPGTPHLISFQRVNDKAHFQELVRKQAERMGAMAEVVGADDRFELKMKFQRLNFNTLNVGNPDKEDDENGERVPFVIARVDVSTSLTPGSISANKGPVLQIPDSISTWYRYHDGFMYVSQQDALQNIDLPQGKSMVPDEDNVGFDVHGKLDFGEIPKHLKQLAWNIWQAHAMTWMQKFDIEKSGSHAVRHALGEGKLELMKTILFDVDTAAFSVNFPEIKIRPRDNRRRTEPQQPFTIPSLPAADADSSGRKELTAKLRIEAREDSQLARSLDQLNRTPSRLGALRNDTSPLVVSTTLDLPEWSQPLVSGVIDSLQIQLTENSGNSGADLLLQDVFEPLKSAAESGKLDFATRMDGNVKTGLVLTGGVRLPDAERFRTSLDLLLLTATDAAKFSVTRSKVADVETTTLGTDRIRLPFLTADIPVQLQFAATGSYLWFAIGGPNSADAMQRQLKNRETILNSQTESMPLLVRLKLSEWLGDHEGASRAPQLLLMEFERSLARLFSGIFPKTFYIAGAHSNADNVISYVSKTLNAESTNFELTARTHGRTLNVESTVGIGVLKFLAAQYVKAQSGIFSGMTFRLSSKLNKSDGGRINTLQLDGPIRIDTNR